MAAAASRARQLQPENGRPGTLCGHGCGAWLQVGRTSAKCRLPVAPVEAYPAAAESICPVFGHNRGRQPRALIDATAGSLLCCTSARRMSRLRVPASCCPAAPLRQTMKLPCASVLTSCPAGVVAMAVTAPQWPRSTALGGAPDTPSCKATAMHRI